MAATTLINNRLILFRGYGECTDKFLYGQYIHLDVAPKLECINHKYRDFIFSQTTHGEAFFPVKENTVGQFTGYYDAHNNPIYEGDIVKLYNAWADIYQVKYLDYIDTFGLQKQNTEHFFLEFRDVDPCNIEITGNIYKLPKNK